MKYQLKDPESPKRVTLNDLAPGELFVYPPLYHVAICGFPTNTTGSIRVTYLIDGSTAYLDRKNEVIRVETVQELICRIKRD